MMATLGSAVALLAETFGEWYEDRAPRLGAALAYYMVFALAPGLISAQILFFGAEFTKVYARRAGMRVVPEEPGVPITDDARAKQGMGRSERLARPQRREERTRRKSAGR